MGHQSQATRTESNRASADRGRENGGWGGWDGATSRTLAPVGGHRELPVVDESLERQRPRVVDAHTPAEVFARARVGLSDAFGKLPAGFRTGGANDRVAIEDPVQSGPMVVPPHGEVKAVFGLPPAPVPAGCRRRVNVSLSILAVPNVDVPVPDFTVEVVSAFGNLYGEIVVGRPPEAVLQPPVNDEVRITPSCGARPVQPVVPVPRVWSQGPAVLDWPA